MSIEELVKHDNNFSEATFKSYVDNVFVKLFTAVMLNDIDSVKHFISDDIYLEYKNKCEELDRNNLMQMYDELNVKSSNISKIEITDDEFIITINLIARYMDYVLKKDSGNFVSGNNNFRIEKSYILVFRKKRAFLEQGAVRKCPGCGASISVNTSGKCDYCGSTYNLEDYDYILSSIN